MSYTNGELRAMLAPVFDIDHDDVQNLIIVVQTSDGYCLTHGLARGERQITDMLAHIQLLSAATAAVSIEAMSKITEGEQGKWPQTTRKSPRDA